MRWRRWGLALAVLATLGGLTVAGRLLDLPENRPPGASPPPPTTVNEVVSIATTPPPATIPAALRRPLRLPSLRRDGSCPTSPTVGPSITRAHPVAAVAVGDGPVYPVLFRATADGRLDHSSVAYWDAPKPLGGPVIVRGHRLGAPKDRVGFQQDQQKSRPVHLLDPASAYRAGEQGSWWRPTRLQAGRGCYGLQIDGAGFSEVLVVEFG
ncbi:MAG TPA: hypothetical protein VJB61_13725 [Actinomycetota bacterium]